MFVKKTRDTQLVDTKFIDDQSLSKLYLNRDVTEIEFGNVLSSTIASMADIALRQGFAKCEG